MNIDNSGETNVDIVSDENLGTGGSISFAELDSNSGNPRLAQKKEDVKEENKEEVIKNKEEVLKTPEVVKNGKKISFSQGETLGELDPDLKLKHRVDGKEVEWTLMELLNDKSGQTAWDKKFQELSVEKNTFKKERDVIEKYVRGFQEVAQKGDSMGAMEYLAQMAGISPLEFKKNLRTQVLPEFEKWQQLSDEAKKFKEIEDENNYFKQQRESDGNKIKEQEAQVALDSKLKSAQEVHGFSDKDLVEAYDVLTEHYKPEQVTLDLVTEYMKERNAVVKAEKLLEQVDTELLQNEKVVDSITDMVLKGRHSDEELLDIIHGSFSKKSTRKKIESKTAPVAERKVENNKNTSVPVRWSDLE